MASDIFNTRTADAILDEMTNLFKSLQPNVSVNEASTLFFLFQVFAYVTANNNDLAEKFANAAFITTAEGDDLTNLAADRGVNRKEAVNSICTLEISRLVADVSTVTIPASSSFSTAVDENGNFLEFKNFDALTITASTTTVTGLAQCQTAGVIGNVVVDTVVEFISAISGADTVTNSSSGSGGVDGETDTNLRQRTIDLLQNNTGRVTVSGYRIYLESLEGVESALVVPGTGAMPNYITAIVTTDQTANGIPTAEQLSLWETLVNSDDNRAVVDVIEVIAPSPIAVDVTAAITSYTASADETTTKARVTQSVTDFINALAPGDTVRVVDIQNVIHDDAGVVDYTMSAPAANLVLTNVEKAIAGTITIT